MKKEKFSVRYQAMEVSSLEMFAGIRGGFHGNCKEVCFARAIGGTPRLSEAIENMDRMLSAQALAGTCRYQRFQNLPVLDTAEKSTCYIRYYEAWKQNRQKLLVKETEKNAVFAEAAGEAYEKVLALFQKLNPAATDTIIKNFGVKLLYWLDTVIGALAGGWMPELSMKIVLQNISRKQEYLFCYLLTQIGVDVLLLQVQTDIHADLERLGLSKKFVLGAQGTYALPAYDITRYSSRQSTEGRPVVHLPERRPRTKTRDMQAAGAGRMEQRQTTNIGRIEQRQTARVSGGRRELDFEELARLAESVVMIVVHDRKGEPISSGSGIMIGKDGYILTNNHVASGGVFYSVRIEDDDAVYETDEVIKYNSVLDLAVLRIARRLKPLPIYQGSKGLVRGQKVVAIGSPLGLFNSVSDGIISGFRNVDAVEMIQFTAPISSGSSGGAVLNLYGEVIGISTAGIDRGQNINLAVGYANIRQFVQGFVSSADEKAVKQSR